MNEEEEQEKEEEVMREEGEGKISPRPPYDSRSATVHVDLFLNYHVYPLSSHIILLCLTRKQSVCLSVSCVIILGCSLVALLMPQ